jgi:hypothetical protein
MIGFYSDSGVEKDKNRLQFLLLYLTRNRFGPGASVQYNEKRT